MARLSRKRYKYESIQKENDQLFRKLNMISKQKTQISSIDQAKEVQDKMKKITTQTSFFMSHGGKLPKTSSTDRCTPLLQTIAQSEQSTKNTVQKLNEGPASPTFNFKPDENARPLDSSINSIHTAM